MRFQQFARQAFLASGLCMVMTGVLAACGGSSTPKAPASASATGTASAAAGSSPAQAAITADWVAFFSARTPVPRRIQLLQNGQTFASIIQAQAGSGLASSASATVTHVTVVSPTRATVLYSILLGGQPALPNQTGQAVYEGGTWKVGDSSFCALLTQENAGSTSSLPAACTAAG
jgi:hypothetical protein